MGPYVIDAAKKHHEYLARLEKDESPEAKAARLKSSRVKQRRIRVRKLYMHMYLKVILMNIYCLQLYERRCMQARGKEVSIMKKISEKVMTDEETDDDVDSKVLVRRIPPWRSTKLTNLMRTLDSRKNAKSEVVPKKERKMGPFSERDPPKDIPKWALQDPISSQLPSDVSSSPGTESNPMISPMSSPVPPPSQTSTPIQTHTSLLQPFTPRAPLRTFQTPCVSPTNTPSRYHNKGNSSSFTEFSSLENSQGDGFSDSDSDSEMSAGCEL